MSVDKNKTYDVWLFTKSMYPLSVSCYHNICVRTHWEGRDLQGNDFIDLMRVTCYNIAMELIEISLLEDGSNESIILFSKYEDT